MTTESTDTTRHLRVVDTVEELRAELQRVRDWAEVMMTQAAAQRVRAERAEARVTEMATRGAALLEQATVTNGELRNLAHHLLDRLGTVEPTGLDAAAGPGDVW